MLQFRPLTSFLLMLVLCSLFGATALAQEQVDSTETVAPEADSTVAIPPSEIVRLAEEANTQLRESQSLLSSRPIAPIEQQLPDASRDITEMNHEFLAARQKVLSIRQLDDRHRSWIRYELIFRNWERDVRDRAIELQDNRKQLGDFVALWTTTYNDAVQDSLPAVVLNRIHSFLTETEATEDAFRDRIDQLLTLQTSLAEEVAIITETLIEIESMQAEAQQQLFLRDRAPLLVAIFTQRDDMRLPAQFRSSLDQMRATLSSFFESNQLQMMFHLVFFLVLLGITVALLSRSKDWPTDEPHYAAATYIVRRPVATALLLTLIFTDDFYPQAPLNIIESAQLLGLLPLLRLMPGLTAPTLRKPFYFFLGLWFFHDLHALALQQSILERLISFVAVAIGFVGLIYLLKPGGRAQSLIGGRWWKASLFAARMATLVLGVSLAANFLGFVLLSIQLSAAVFNSFYAAIVYYATAQVFGSGWYIFLHSRFARSLNAVRNNTELLWKRGTTLIYLGTLCVWIWTTLKMFVLEKPAKALFSAIMDAGLSVGSITITIGGVAAFILTMWLARLVSRMVRFILKEDVFSRLDMPRGTPSGVMNLTNYFILGLGFFFAIAAAGIELSTLALLAGAFGIGIGFGLQDIVNNFISGLVLIFERPIQIGDTVQLETLFGEVKRIGIRSSTVRTYEGAEVIVPNSQLVSSQVINWTLSDRLRRIDVPVGVAYGTPIEPVMEMLVKAAKKHDTVLSYPAPNALFQGFGDSSLDFIVRFWTADFDNWMQIKSDIGVAVNNAIVEAGVEIPFPQRDLHLRSMDDDIPKALTPNGTPEETPAVPPKKAPKKTPTATPPQEEATAPEDTDARDTSEPVPVTNGKGQKARRPRKP